MGSRLPRRNRRDTTARNSKGPHSGAPFGALSSYVQEVHPLRQLWDRAEVRAGYWTFIVALIVLLPGTALFVTVPSGVATRCVQ